MFKSMKVETLPPNALLARYEKTNKAHTDCFSTIINHKINLSDYIQAFYTTRLFKIERLILTLIGKPSNDNKAKELAENDQNDFAAWTVEDRNNNQILLCDFMGKTRSWLMVEAIENDQHTKLYFGSAVVFGSKDLSESKPSSGFSLLSRFHVLYSKALLSAARRKLDK